MLPSAQVPFSTSSPLFETFPQSYQEAMQQQHQEIYDPHELPQSYLQYKKPLPSSSEHSQDYKSHKQDHEEEIFPYIENKPPQLTSSFQIHSCDNLNSTDILFNNQCNKLLFATSQDPTSQDQKVCDEYISPTQHTVESPNKISTLKDDLSSVKVDHLVNIPPNELLTSEIKNTINQIPNRQIHTDALQYPDTKETQSENTQISSNEHAGSSNLQISSCSTGFVKQISSGSHKTNNRPVSKKNTQNSTYHDNHYRNNNNNQLIPSSKRTIGGNNSNPSNMNHGIASSGNYPTNNTCAPELHSANEGNCSNYPYYGGANNTYASSNIPNNSHSINHNSHSIRNPSQSQVSQQQYFGEEADAFSGYNDIYAGYYYPSYPLSSVEQISEGGKKMIEGMLDEGEDPTMTEEYKKYYQYGHQSTYGYFQNQNTFIPSNEVPQSGLVHSNVGQAEIASQHSQNLIAPPQQSSTFFSNSQEGTGNNPQVLQNECEHAAAADNKYDHSYLRDYYDPNAYYPPSSYYYPPANEIYPITGAKKPSKKAASGCVSHHHLPQASSHSGQSKSQGCSTISNSSKYPQTQTIYGSSHDGNGLHDPYTNTQGLNQGQQIYCDPSYYCSDPLYKKPQHNSNLESDIYKSELQKDNASFHKEKSLKSNSRNRQPREKVDLADAYGNDNQESSPQNNQSTSHEIRKRKRKNNDQLKILKIEYQKGGFWGKEKILEVAQITGLSESQVYKWCWDQKKKRLETFKKRLGNKLITGQVADDDQPFEDMSGDGLDEDSYRQTGSPDKLLKLNDETGVVAIKANISKLSNDFTISQLQEKVLAGKTRVLQNITEKVMSRQNSKTDTEINPALKINSHSNNNNNNNKLAISSSSFYANNINHENTNHIYDIQHEMNGQENIHPDSSAAHQLSVFQPQQQSQLQQSYEDTPKRVQSYSVF